MKGQVISKKNLSQFAKKTHSRSVESTVDKNSDNQTLHTVEKQSSLIPDNNANKDKQEGYLTRVQSLKKLEESLKSGAFIQNILGESKQSYQ